MARGKRHSHDYPLGTSWAGSNRPSSSTLHPRPYSPCPIVRGTYSSSTWRSLGSFLAGPESLAGLATLSSGSPETDEKLAFLIVFRQEAGLVFNRDVGKGAMKDRVGFDATSAWHIAFTF